MEVWTAGEGIARWRQVADALRGAIAAERITDRLPPESELATQFGVNRHTARRAIAALAADGLVRAERGRGTFVVRGSERLAYPIGASTRFSENVSAASREPGGRLIGSSREHASLAIAERLSCRPGTELVRMETLRVADGVPLLVATIWFPADRFAGIVAAYAETGSITKALKLLGQPDYRRVETRVTAEAADLDDARHLGCTVGATLLQTVGVNVDHEGTPIQLSRTRFLADRVELVLKT